MRLDPPYWATLLLATANRYVPWLDPIREKSLRPPIDQVVSHVFYLQNVLGEGDIVVVFWTLCIEVQFYLVFILLRGLEERLRRAKDPRSSERTLLLVFAPPALASLAYLLVDSSKSAWLIPYWYMFALGAGASAVVSGQLRARFLGVFAALVIAVAWRKHALEPFVAVLVAGLIYVAFQRGGLHRWLRQRPFQYLGAISYSLYLVHHDIGFRIFKEGMAQTGERPWAALGWFLLALASSLAVAAALHHVVERPSMRFAATLKA